MSTAEIRTACTERAARECEALAADHFEAMGKANRDMDYAAEKLNRAALDALLYAARRIRADGGNQ